MKKLPGKVLIWPELDLLFVDRMLVRFNVMVHIASTYLKSRGNNREERELFPIILGYLTLYFFINYDVRDIHAPLICPYFSSSFLTMSCHILCLACRTSSFK